MLVKSVFLSCRSSLTFSIQIFLCPLCFSFSPHVHVKLHLVVFSPPSVLRVQTTVGRRGFLHKDDPSACGLANKADFQFFGAIPVTWGYFEQRGNFEHFSRKCLSNS